MKLRIIGTTLVLSLGVALAVAIIAGSPAFQRQEKYFFQLDVTSTAGGVAQLFFDIGSGFIEKDSAVEPVSPNRTTRFRFPLPRRKVSSLRFDPVNNQAEVTIAAPAVVDSKGAIVHRLNPTDFKAGPHVKSIQPQGDRLTMLCVEGGVDPSLIVDLPFKIRPPLVTKDWVRAITSVGVVVFLLVMGLALACYSARVGIALGAVTISLQAKPLLTLLVFSGVGVLLQFHPLFFATPRSNLAGLSSNTAQTSIVSLTTYNSSYDQFNGSPSSVLAWADIFSLIPKLVGNANWAIATGIFTAWWAYVFGCALLAWLITRSLSTAAIVVACALLSRVWATGVLPLSTPAIAAAPWALLAWGAVATAPRSSKLFFLSGAAIFIANLEMVAAECSLRVATLAVATAAAGVFFVGLQRQSKSSRILRASIGLTFFSLFAVVVAVMAWGAIQLPGDGSPEAARTLIQTIPASASLSFFEGFFWQNPGSYPLPSANLVVLAGLAWAFARSDETFKKTEFIALLLTIAPLVVLASGAVPDNVLAAWFKHANTARFQEAAWYSLVFFSVILASFGFVGLRQLCAAQDSIFDIAKATIIFFVLFAMYFGTFQYHSAYTFKTAYLISIIIGWVIAHVAMARLHSTPETQFSIALVSCVFILACWPHAPYVHLFIREALLE